MGKLQDKIAIVTGATSGIGKGITKVFCQEGAKVVFCGRREANGKEFEKELRDLGYDVAFFKADVSVEEDIKNLVQFTVETYGRVDVLVNNAGVMPQVSIVDQSAKQIEDTYKLNIIGFMLSSKYAIPHMSKGSSIINIASCGGLRAGALASSYGSSKAAVIHYSQIAARELGPQGIRVNAISPGPFMTEMVAGSIYADDNPELTAGIPLGRFGRVEELGNAAAFLASEEASFITGINLVVDGGVIS